MYDSVEQTFQRYRESIDNVVDGDKDDTNENSPSVDVDNEIKIDTELRNSQKRMQVIIYVLAGAVAVLLVALIVVTILGLKSTRIQETEEDDEFGAEELKNTPYGALKKDGFDVEVSVNDTFPEEEQEEYEDEDLEMVDL